MGNEFSVLMLVYGGDRPAHFDAALRSIAAQTLPPAEIVLVVDGSAGRHDGRGRPVCSGPV